jgi:dolichol-phosphate mannosyltransferase
VEPIDVVLPAHNEAESIEATLKEFHRVVTAEHGIAIRFVVSEDGSTDGTPDVIRQLEGELPILLLTGPERKGYSRAVIDGVRATTAELVAFIDADGQCDPIDLPRLLAHMDGTDLVVGKRTQRQDHWSRRLMSGAFKVVYRLLFRVPAKDPSCPFMIVRRPALERILTGKVGVLKQGFWWEFLARAAAADVRMVDVPVNHRVRTAGSTQVYKPSRLPRIAAEHLLGLVRLRRELSSRH